MANLGNLIVRGVTRILGDAYANKFIGNLQGNADTATSAIKASTADSATNATSANKASIATAVQDYGTSDYREIKIGYNGSGLSSSDITHAVGFTDSGTKIKDISKDEFRNWLATASGTWNISITGNAATATNADALDGFHESDFSRHIEGRTGPGSKGYYKIGSLPASSNGTYDAFLIQGEIGGWSSSYKAVLNICVGRRDGVRFSGYTQGLWQRDLGIDIGINDAGEIVLIVTGDYTSWTLDLHTIQGTISYTGTNFTPADTNFVLLSASNNVCKSLADGTVEKTTKLKNSRTIWGQSFDGTKNISGALTEVTDITASGNILIGTTTDYSSGKLQINGGTTLTGYMSSGSVSKIADLGENGLVVSTGPSRSGWGMALWTEGNGKGYIQQQAFNSDATTYALCLNPFGGNVGIGTNSPYAKLEVNGKISSKKEIDVWEGNTKDRLTLYEYQGIGRIYSYNEANGTFGDLWIGNNSGNILNVKTNGNVGIGTASPSYKLHVVGDIYTTTGFKKVGSSDSYVLLGGGGHKVVSDFATSSEVVTSLGTSGNYLTWTKNGSTNNITVPYATNTDTVDGYHISDNYNLPYKNITNLTCTPSSIAGDYWYVKILIQYSYQGIVNQKMYLIASYSNLMTKAELQVYGYYLGYKYTASWYNEDTITGIASTRQDASQVIWLRMKKPIQYEGVIPDGSISIYSNYIASAEVITSAPSGVIFTDTLQSDGQHILSGDIKAESFKKNGSDDNYVLLGGGGHKAISDFATTSWVNDNFYTYSESDNRYIQSETDPIWTADKVNYYTKTECNNKFQLKGEYLTEQNLQGYATTTWVNSNYYTCLESDSRYIQSETDPVWTAAKGNYYTKNECNNRYIQSETDPVWTAAKSNYYTKTECDNRYQPKGTYLTEQNLQGYATQEWVRGEEYLYRSGGTMDARAEIGITTKLFIGNSTSSDTCYTKFNCILHGGGDESNPNWVIRDNGYAEFKSSVSANAFYASSDIRLKNILNDINIDFDKLKLIPKKYYTWKGSDILQLGTIAQDIQKIYPEVVSKNENGYLSVDYSKLSIIALAAIDKLNERIKELECQIKL